jgi:glucokinase
MACSSPVDTGDASRILLGFDIGGTKAVAVLAREGGDVLAETRLEGWARGSWQADCEVLLEEADTLLQSAGLARSALSAVGVSAPGPLDGRRGIVIDTPVILENDANAAALAEWQFGAGRGTRNLVYLTMSTGVGSGLILEGALYPGSRWKAGEIGHAPIRPGGRRCNCGLRGCLEAYTGGAAIAQRIREDIAAGQQTAILDLAGGKPEAVSARVWVQAVRAGDAYALALLDDWLDALAQGLAIAIAVLDPDCIVLGTIVQKNPDLFLGPLRERVRALVWDSFADVRLEPSQLGDALPRYAALSVAALAPR